MTQPIDATAAMAEAAVLEANGQFSAAESLYRELIARDTCCHAAWHALGLLAYRAGRLDAAAQFIAQAITHDAASALYQRNYGELCRRLGRHDEAVAAGRRAVELAAGDVQAHYNLALALADSGKLAEAADCYRDALKCSPDYGLAWNNLGAALELLGDYAGAEQAYAHAVELNPQHAEAQNNLAAIYTKQGKLSAAIDGFNAAIRARPSFVEAHCNLSSLKRYTEDDAHVLVLQALSETWSSASIDDRIRLNFALGKARDDLGDYRGAFTAYALGNNLKYQQQPYDEQSADATLAAFIKTFDSEYFAAHWSRELGDAARTPIFIVGMPRSGSSLLEQILASHPAVYGAGELSTLNDVMNAAIHSPLPARVAELTAANLQQCAEQYLQRVWQLAPHNRYIVDKMPANYFWIGIIHRILPQAKIIHTLRDPMDVALSCFSRLFDDPGMAFTYDLAVLGRYYCRYAALMQHWRRVLPRAAILDVRYEDMVAEPEQQTRRMLDFIGLPWDAATMSFHANQRQVKTASLAQVRQPIYDRSVGRWRHFEAQLAPLRAQLEALRSPIVNDREMRMDNS